jgi:uncharacterized protein (UPF0332 family)
MFEGSKIEDFERCCKQGILFNVLCGRRKIYNFSGIQKFREFLTAKALLSKKDSYPRTHGDLISQFRLLFVKKGEFKKELFDLFTKAQEDREEADYGLFLELDKEEALIIIKCAEQFLRECKLILSNI